MNRQEYKLGKIGHVKKPNEEIKEQKQIRKNTFRNFINKKCNGGVKNDK